MQRVLHGFEIDKPDEPDPFDYDDLAHAVIKGELSAPEGLGYARNYERESKLPGGVRKATVVGPLEIAVHAQDQQEELHAPDAEPDRHRQPRDARRSPRPAARTSSSTCRSSAAS